MLALWQLSESEPQVLLRDNCFHHALLRAIAVVSDNQKIKSAVLQTSLMRSAWVSKVSFMGGMCDRPTGSMFSKSKSWEKGRDNGALGDTHGNVSCI